MTFGSPDRIDYLKKAYMKAFRQFGTPILLLVSYLTPAMACMLPAAQMTAQEQACCRMMHNQCEQMDMSMSHGCCQKAPRAIYAVPATKAETVHFVAVSVGDVLAFDLLKTISVSAIWVDHPEDSPPQSPSATISILRI